MPTYNVNIYLSGFDIENFWKNLQTVNSLIERYIAPNTAVMDVDNARIVIKRVNELNVNDCSIVLYDNTHVRTTNYNSTNFKNALITEADMKRKSPYAWVAGMYNMESTTPNVWTPPELIDLQRVMSNHRVCVWEEDSLNVIRDVVNMMFLSKPIVTDLATHYSDLYWD